MHRSLFLCLGLLLVSLPAPGQSTSTDSQTLQALLAEVRQLRQDMKTTSLAAVRAQILLHRSLSQEAVLERATQRLDDARARVTELQFEQKKAAAEIKRSEDFVNDTDSPPARRKEVEDSLPASKSRFESGEALVQQLQSKEIEAEAQLRLEQAKLDVLHDQLERVMQTLDKASQPPDSGRH